MLGILESVLEFLWFNDAVSNLGYITPNGRMISWKCIGKDVEGSGRDIISSLWWHFDQNYYFLWGWGVVPLSMLSVNLLKRHYSHIWLYVISFCWWVKILFSLRVSRWYKNMGEGFFAHSTTYLPVSVAARLL